MGVSRSLVIRVLVIAFVVASCAPAPSSNIQFPIIGSDPDGLVETMEWVETSDATPGPDAFSEPLVLDGSTALKVEIAVKGGGCPPSAQVGVSGTADAVEIAINLGGTIEPPGVTCEAVLTTHVLAITFNQPINMDTLVVSSVRTGIADS